MAKPRKVGPPLTATGPTLPVPMPLKVKREDPAALGTADCKTIARCSDGLDYAIKDKSSHPYTPHAEWFCTHLANLLGIAVPDCRIVEMTDKSLAFGSRWEGGAFRRTAPNGTPLPQWYDYVHQGLVKVADISPILSRIYAFDHVIHNYDRHATNFLARGQRDPTGADFALFAFDYSRAWTFHGFPLPNLPFNVIDPNEKTVKWQREFTKLVGNYIDAAVCQELLQSVKQVSVSLVEQIIQSHPNEWLPATMRRAIVKWWGSKEFVARIDGIAKGIANGTYL